MRLVLTILTVFTIVFGTMEHAEAVAESILCGKAAVTALSLDPPSQPELATDPIAAHCLPMILLDSEDQVLARSSATTTHCILTDFYAGHDPGADHRPPRRS
ncbi:hypothetical protein [Aureimonas sp. SK2]|uniref:hypothetical protein n=1 Tax=Aureimonas sp. SK2 TaxID=3015992 RepID=UPI002443B39E|nr:hypothetical protein [Aureimonas sp. SK2]